jgi:hypothetical protein
MSASSGSSTPVPLVGMAADTGMPGADGLTPTAAFVIGVNNSIADNLVPGITDLAALQEGLVSSTSLVNLTGVVAALPLQGQAQAIVLAGSAANAAALTAYIATGSYGLAIVDVSSFQTPTVLGELQLSGTATGVGVDTALGLAALADGTVGLRIIDIADPTKPQLVQTVAMDATAVQVVNGTAYVNDGGNLDAVDLTTGQIQQSLSLGASLITAMARDGTTLYTMDASNTLRVIDLSSGSMVSKGSLTLSYGGSNGDRIFVAGGVAYVGAAGAFNGGYATVDVSNPSAPKLIEGPDANNIAGTAIALNGSGLGVLVGRPGGVFGTNAIDVVNASDPSRTGQFETRYTLPQQPYDVAIGDGIAFVADGSGGLQVVNYEPFDTTGIPPTVQITQLPTSVNPGASEIEVYEGENVTIGATIGSNVQVRNVELLVNGQPALNDVSYPFNLTTLMPTIAANGGSNQATLQVEAIDTGGNTTISSPIDVQLVPDPTPPQLLFENISNGEDLFPTSRAFIFQFSEPLDPTTVTSTTFALLGPGGAAIAPQTIQLRENGQRVELDYPTLAAGDYQFVIAAPSVTSTSGGALGSTNLTTSFTVLPFTAFWNNPAGGDWSVASNWQSGQLPAATDVVLIDLVPGNAVTLGGTATVASIAITGGGTLAVNFGGLLTVSGQLNIASVLQLDGTIKQATIINSGGSIAYAGGTLDGTTIQGTLDLSAAQAAVYVNDGITLTGAGGSGNGTINLTGRTSALYAEGTETLDNATLNIGSNSTSYLYNYDANGPAVLTLGAHLAINQTDRYADLTGYSNRGGSGIVNAGIINANFSGGTFNIGDVSFSNQGAITVSGGDALNIMSTAWSNTGSITLNGGTLGLGGNFTMAQLGTLNRSGGTVNVIGTLDNTGVTLNVGTGTTLGTLTLASGGTIKNGTIIDAGSGLAFSRGTLDRVTYQGTLDLSGSGAAAYVNDGITLTGTGGSGNGTINLTGAGSVIDAEGTETLDNATLNIGNNSTDYLYNYDANGPAVLTLGAHLTITQAGSYAYLTGYSNRSGSGIVNAGTINANFSGGTFNIGDVSFSNQGAINVSNGDMLNISSTAWSNAGSITLNGGTLGLGGSFTLAQLGTLNRTGGTVNLTGTLDDTGVTLNVGTGTTLGTLTLASGSAIKNGTIADAGSGLSIVNGTLDGVTYQGTLDLSGYSAVLNVTDGITLTGAGGSGSSTINLTGFGSLMFVAGTETLDNATLNIGYNGSGGGTLYGLSNTPGGAVLTLGSNLTVDHTGNFATIAGYTVGDGVVNDGTINANLSGGTFKIGGPSFTNQGTIAVSNGDTLNMAATAWTNTGTITLNGGTLGLGGSFTLAQLATLSRSGGTINLTGKLDLTGATLNIGTGTALGTLTLASGGTIKNGTIADAGSGLPIVYGTLDGVTYQGTLDLSGSGAALYLKHGLILTGSGGSGTGTINLTGQGSVIIAEDTEALDNATLNIATSSGHYSIANDDTSTNGAVVLTFGPHLTINQTGNYAVFTDLYSRSGSGIVNTGTINAGFSGGNFTISGANFTNNGTVNVANADKLSITVPLDGNGSISLASQGNVEINGSVAAAQTIAFLDGGNDVLRLDKSMQFAGTISGFTGTNALDLADITSGASATIGYAPNSGNTGGTLSVSDGTHTATIALLGQYTAASFAAASDGHSGTMITDPPFIAQNQLVQPHA